MSVQKVLIVDDSKTETLLIAAILRENGYGVATAEGADQAMEKIAMERPDLILMDIVMPGRNGFQLTRTINRTPEFADIPIIFCTSKSLETDKVWGLRQGARDYIIKPVNAAELIAKIKALG
ncbi:MAG: response regulator [Rhodoferax sp.]|jgi:twitching motility two-component system response regulator PilH|nr:response regulator [Rhodoferax sp.]